VEWVCTIMLGVSFFDGALRSSITPSGPCVVDGERGFM
jgi:hypothetical protein